MLAGIVQIVPKDNVSFLNFNITTNITGIKFQVKVIEVESCNEQTLVPTQGDIVTAIVMLITQQYCKCVIKCIGSTVLSRPYRAILRKEDVRATEKDKVEIYKSFRPGDIILARVVSFFLLIYSTTQ